MGKTYSILFRCLAPGGVCYLMPGGWYYQNKLAVGRVFQQWLLRIIDAKQQLASPKIENQARAFWANWVISPQNLLAQMCLTESGGSSEKFAYGQSAVNMAHVACALEHYYLSHGKYPETLDALVPQFFKKLPHDIIGGQPLHYRRMANGKFILYSVGWNEMDDGGVVGLAKDGYGPNGDGFDYRKGDWVWRN